MTPRSRSAGRYLVPLIALLAAAAALAAWLHFGDPGKVTAGPALSAQKARTRGSIAAPNAIAVLPFRLPGLEGETTPHAFGFAHDLLRELADHPDLLVIAPTSSLYFRDVADQRRRTANRLRAGWLLGGEWRLEGGLLRLSLELYREETGRTEHEWALDTAFDDPAGVLREVADEVLERLPVTAGSPKGPPSPVDAEAWLRYAEGVYYASAAGEPDPVRAEAALQAALALDASFAAASLQRAELLLHPAWPAAGRAERVEQARRIAVDLLSQDAGNGRALALLAWIHHDFDWDWEGALEHGTAAVASGSGDAAVLRLAGIAAFSMGDFQRAVAWLEAAAVRDPLNLGGRVQLGLAQEHARDDEAALLTLRQVAVLNPDYPGLHAQRARLKLLEGKPEVVRVEAERETHPFWSAYADVLALAARGRPEEARSRLEELSASYADVAAFQVAELHALQGRPDAAFEWLTRAIQQRDGGVSALLGNRLLEPLHGDVRWSGLLERLDLPLDSPNPAAENE